MKTVEGRTTATQQDQTRLLYPSTQALLRNRRAAKLLLSQFKQRRDLEAYQACFTQARRRTRRQPLKHRLARKATVFDLIMSDLMIECFERGAYLKRWLI
jgi:hypothetical protein